MPDFNPFQYVKEAGGVFKFGSGVMGKSSIVVGILMCAVVIAASRLHSDYAVLGALFLGATIFLVWLSKVLTFAGKHPDVAVLEGAEWSGFQRFRAEAKGFIPPINSPVVLPNGSQQILGSGCPVADEEQANG